MPMIKTNLHIHSYLSPCADDDMNPFDIVGMAKVSGLDLIALTDHNSLKNVGAAALAAEKYGVGFIPGVEVNTSEEIHCMCLFPSLEKAEEFDVFLEGRLPKIKNRPDIIGTQTICHKDETESECQLFLLGATDISINDLPEIVSKYGGICWPAHVDRDENGLLAVFGMWPVDLNVKAAEIIRDRPSSLPDDILVIRASDAHNMSDLQEFSYEMPLETADFNGLKAYIEKARASSAI